MPGDNRIVHDAFLCHHGRDLAPVGIIAESLKRQGLAVVADKGELHPGDPINDELERALQRSRALVIFLSPQSIGRWQTDEAHEFLESALEENPLRVIPVLLPGLTPEVRQQIPMFFQRNFWIEFDREVREGPTLQALANAIKQVRNLTEGSVLVGPAALNPAEVPYRGWAPFDEKDRQWFFGRERLLERLLIRLRGTPFVTLLGPAHSGKTSLIRAGLLPELKAQGWICASVAPLGHPLIALANAVSGMQGDNFRWKTREILDHLENAGPPILGVLADQILEDRDLENALLIVDPLEQVFEEATDPQQRERFLKVIAATARSETRLRIVTLLRTEFLGDCALHPELNRMVTRNLIQISPMTEEELREAIVGPALAKGLAFEDGLVDRIMADLNARGRDLPLLEHALAALYERRTARQGKEVLTVQAYEDLGGVVGSIGKRAEEALGRVEDRFGERGVEAIRSMFLLHLIHPESGAVLRRRAAPLEEVRQVDPDTVLVEHILSEWTEAGLLTVRSAETTARLVERQVAKPGKQEDPAAVPTHVMVAHEALLEHWPRLQEWITMRYGDARLVAAFRKDEQAWREHGRSADRLLTGSRLVDAEHLRARYENELPVSLNEFIVASIKAREDAERERAGALQRELGKVRELADKREAARLEAERKAVTEAKARAHAETRAAEQAAAAERARSQLRSLKRVLFIFFLLLAGIGFAVAVTVLMGP